jgi:putative tricarboxylic transport membrane protein
MAKISKFQYELIFEFFSMILGFVIIIVSLRYGFGILGQPGPGLYPFFLGLAILLLSILLLILTAKSGSGEPLFDRYGIKKFLLATITFILWIIAMPYLGYVIDTLIVTYCLSKIMRLEGWLKPLALSIGTALFIYLLFDYWLYIDLPRGIFG